jgi:hypothetical protein
MQKYGSACGDRLGGTQGAASSGDNAHMLSQILPVNP